MTMDYDKLGFKCGLECHQQLEGKKLFCDCPTLNSDKEPNRSVGRKLRAVVGETGEIDKAAQYEMSKKNRFIYEGNSENVCLLEFDEEPPHELNKRALETAIKVALLMNAKVVDEIQIMRKTVVDGSNVSGFQRTALVAMNGHLETPKGKVTIPSICIEEEAAQKLKGTRDFLKFKLDRLGIPLIEIATGTEIKDAEHAKEVAGKIGMILRSVGGVKRGLGTIRQDVNVSIKHGERTEIKGFQDLKSIPKIINYEVERQKKLITDKKKIEKQVRKAESDFSTSYLRPMPGAARLYPETDVLPVRVSNDYVAELREKLPKLITVKTKEFEKKYDLPKNISKELINNKMFLELAKKFPKIQPAAIASTIITVPKEIKTRFKLDTSQLTQKDFEEVFKFLSKSIVTKDVIIQLLIKKIKGEKIDASEFKSISDNELEEFVKKIISEKPNLNIGAYMGLVMAKYRGKVDGKKAMEIIKKNL
jgi:Glu-tRNA(Gln) amidotransferase subunit E-like FAD-binding protein